MTLEEQSLKIKTLKSALIKRIARICEEAEEHETDLTTFESLIKYEIEFTKQLLKD